MVVKDSTIPVQHQSPALPAQRSAVSLNTSCLDPTANKEVCNCGAAVCVIVQEYAGANRCHSETISNAALCTCVSTGAIDRLPHMAYSERSVRRKARGTIVDIRARRRRNH